MTDSFTLDPRLQRDCRVVAELPLSAVLLMNDAHYPWCILVPRRADIRELYELSEADYEQLQLESRALGRALMEAFQGDKLNVAALGNVVAQLHIHHIVRYSEDPAWPDPVWGKYPAKPYTDDEADKLIERIRQALQLTSQ